MPNQLTLREDAQTQSPMALMQRALDQAINQGAALEVVDRLIKAQRDMIEYNAKVEWREAMARVQGKIKRVAPDLENPQTHSKYASYAKLDSILRPLYEPEGFALLFGEAVSTLPDHKRVTCKVVRGGHEEPFWIDIPVDSKGPKGQDLMTKTHAAVSADSYGMRRLLRKIFNVAIGEGDDDGNAAGGKRGEIGDQQFIALRDNIEGAANEAELRKFYQEAQKVAEEAGDVKADRQFESSKNKRYRELKAAK